MKWSKPGHELDELASIICKTEQKYYIWGTANIGHSILKLCKEGLKIVGAVDGDERKQGTNIDTMVIESPDVLKNNGDYKVIVTSSHYKEISQRLRKEGFRENIDFFDYFPFLQIYMMYKQNRLYSRRIDISLTERCTLKCKKCNMFMPYFKNPTDMLVEDVKRQIDEYFSLIDYAESFNLLGGEPLMYAGLAEVIAYIGEKYRTRIQHLKIFTNATIVPNNQLLDVMSEYNVEVQISDYSMQVPYHKRVEEVQNILTERKIEIITFRSKTWGNFGFPDNPDNVPEEKMISHFDGCKAPFRGLYNGRIYFCHLETSAIRAELYKDNENDYFDLRKKTDDMKMKFLEFDFGYCAQGAISFCKLCRGCDTINDMTVTAAEQMGEI